MDEKRNTYQLLKYFTILLFFFVTANLVNAQQKILKIDEDISSIPIGKYVYSFKDLESAYKDSEIIKVAQFEPENKDIPVNSTVFNGTIWAKFKVVNTTADSIFFFKSSILQLIRSCIL